MKICLRCFKTALCLLYFFNVDAQYSVRRLPGIDSIAHQYQFPVSSQRSSKFFRPYFLPALAIAYGFTGLENHGIQNLDFEVKEELYLEHTHEELHLDNYLQFSPGVAVYGLNALGIKGKNNFRDRSAIYVMSNLILNSTCQVVKHITKAERPDGSSFTSFPSGHTAEAFASAEFLSQEYKNVSPWYGIAGYGIAAATGYMRIYNNKHWLSDVVAGAGIGVASTKLSYWLYPKIKNLLFKKQTGQTMVMPFYNNNTFGLGMAKCF
jgi:hypothetical protein